MTFSNFAAWRSSNKRIDVYLYGKLCGDQYALGELDITGSNLVLDQHHQTSGQWDLRLAGKYDDVEPEDYLDGIIGAYEDDGTAVASSQINRFFIRNATYNDADDTTVLRLFTAESFVVDMQFSIDDAWTGTTVTLESWIKKLLDAALPHSVVLKSNGLLTGINVLADQQRGLIGNSFMTHIDNLLRPLNLRIVALPTYVSTTFSIEDRTVVDPTTLPVTALEDGPGKLLLDASIEKDRERTYNAVTLRYWWDNGTTSQNISSYARKFGDFYDNSPERAGFKIYTEEISGGISQTEANTAARETLIALMRRYELLRMKLVLCPWVKPGERITYGGQDWEISKVQHDIVSDVTNLEAESLAAAQSVTNYTPTL